MKATYRLAVSLDSRPKDDPIEVPPFGVVPNGKSIEVVVDSDEVEKFVERFKDAYGMKLTKGKGGEE